MHDWRNDRTVNAASSATAGLSVTTIVSFAAVKGDLKRVKTECDARHIRIRYWEKDERIRVSTTFSRDRPS